jgi:hypothetical protein
MKEDQHLWFRLLNQKNVSIFNSSRGSLENAKHQTSPGRKLPREGIPVELDPLLQNIAQVLKPGNDPGLDLKGARE